MSAHTHLYVIFDYNRTPLVPPGLKAIIHDKPEKRGSWAPHGQEGWYIGPAMNRYRCYTIYNPKTRMERVGDTVDFFPHKTKIPFLTMSERAVIAANELTQVLQNPKPPAPFDDIGIKMKSQH